MIRATGVTRRRPTLPSAIVRNAEVFRPAVIEAVPAVIVSHNHPSGDPAPAISYGPMKMWEYCPS